MGAGATMIVFSNFPPFALIAFFAGAFVGLSGEIGAIVGGAVGLAAEAERDKKIKVLNSRYEDCFVNIVYLYCCVASLSSTMTTIWNSALDGVRTPLDHPSDNPTTNRRRHPSSPKNLSPPQLLSIPRALTRSHTSHILLFVLVQSHTDYCAT